MKYKRGDLVIAKLGHPIGDSVLFLLKIDSYSESIQGSYLCICLDTTDKKFYSIYINQYNYWHIRNIVEKLPFGSSFEEYTNILKI